MSGEDTCKEEQDINVCPTCGREADSGFDRGYPPNPYECRSCDVKRKVEAALELPRDFAVWGWDYNAGKDWLCLLVKDLRVRTTSKFYDVVTRHFGNFYGDGHGPRIKITSIGHKDAP